MLFHLERMKHMFDVAKDEDGSQLRTIPLFPAKGGGTLSKTEAIEAIRHTAKRCGACLTSRRAGTAEAMEP